MLSEKKIEVKRIKKMFTKHVAVILFLLVLSSHAKTQNTVPIDLATIFKLQNITEIKEKFGESNVQRIRPDMEIGDDHPIDYSIYKGTENEFSILFSEGHIAAVVVRTGYRGNALNIPYKPGLSLNDLYKINGKPFSFYSHLREIDWDGGFFNDPRSCMEIYIFPKDDLTYIDFKNKFSRYEIFYNSPEIKEYDLKVSRIIYYHCRALYE